MQKYIFLDTNNWIYLSNGFNIHSSKHDELHLKVFETIRKRVDEGILVFLVNSIVLEEWERNKEQTTNQLKEIENKLRGHKGNLKSLQEFINSDIEIEEVSTLKTILEEKFKEKIERHKTHILNVEHFLKNQTLIIPISDEIKIEATNLALEKKAPFIGDKKNSMADALLLLSSIEYLFENHKQFYTNFGFNGDEEILYFPDSFFVSSNKGDFSSPTDKEIIHQDLKPFLKKTKTKFFFTLAKLIDFLEEKFLSEEEQYLIEDVEYGIRCDCCHYSILKFSDFFKIYNPNKNFIEKNQLSFEFDEKEHNLKLIEEMTSPYSKIRTANCEECGAEFIECLCGELNSIEDHNSTFECVGDCGTKFRINADIDRKGNILSLDYELIKEFKCNLCSNEFESVDDNGHCEMCAEYEKINAEN